MSNVFSQGTKESIKDVVREVLGELGIARNGYLDCSSIRCAEDPDILKLGMILEGTCKCNESKKDYFVILKGVRLSNLNIKCLTRKDIGWSEKHTDAATGGRTHVVCKYASQLSNELSGGFEEYTYRIIPGLTLDTFREVIKNEQQSE